MKPFYPAHRVKYNKDVLYLIRMDMNLTTDKAAKKCGFSSSYWSALENGYHKDVHPRFLLAISENLGVPLNKLTKDDVR